MTAKPRGESANPAGKLRLDPRGSQTHPAAWQFFWTRPKFKRSAGRAPC